MVILGAELVAKFQIMQCSYVFQTDCHTKQANPSLGGPGSLDPPLLRVYGDDTAL